jgi:membrane protease YdiL (CAAX protease family)
LFSAAYVIMRQLDFSWRDLGLSWRSLPLQLLIGLTGILFGITEYFILRPDPLVESLSWQQIWLPAAILLISTGFLEEYVFRFLMQRTSVERLGRVLGIVYVGLLFAVLHIGYRSIVDLLFVLVVGLFFGLMAWKTRSIVGVTISHGLTNIMLFLIVPFVVLGIGVSPFDGARSLLDRGTHVTPTERLPDAAKTVPGDSAAVEAISAAASKQTNQPGSDQVLDREAPDDNQEIDVSGLIIVDYSPGSELDVPSGVTTPQIASFRVVPYVSEVDGPADPN